MNTASVFHPKNWSKIGATGSELTDKDRHNILLSQMAVLGWVVSLVHLVNDLFFLSIRGIEIDFTFIAVLGIIYWLNEHGRHLPAKIIHLVFLNAAMFTLCAVTDKNSRFIFNFFPLIITCFLIFHRSEIWLGYLFSALTTVLVIILEVTDYHPFGNITIMDKGNIFFLLTNIISSFVMLVFAMFFLIRMNNKAEKRLTLQQEQLKKTNAELDRFVYSVSHDLRAPLLSVKGLIGIRNPESPDKALWEMVEGRINKLDNFIQDIIHYSRNARTEVLEENVDLKALVDEVIESLQYMTPEGNVRFEKEIFDGEVWADKIRLSIVLNNLISNALKYRNPYSKEAWIRVSVTRVGNLLTIGISDNGIGIAEEHQQKIFGMFYRAHETSSGSGLGLYIVKEVVAKIDGTITLESAVSKGSVFTVVLPLRQA